MDSISFSQLLQGILNLSWGAALMMAVGGVLIYLAVAKEYEPMLLLPIGAGAILANLPLSPMLAEDGLLTVLYNAGVANEVFPLLIFVGIG
ncbi:MAG: sodium ion-translocating decarboxylase subunit beta, partial [Chloroflexota bacterium]